MYTFYAMSTAYKSNPGSKNDQRIWQHIQNYLT